ncbi:MAG: UDP-N-acetylmuramoyl-L-alanyl-D-glutamate--2,6-diaminopimelate ligase [Chlamydiales bacterium]|nr:UDP-N-acetylmuramoyl-L-alanyl-D-glutamate--2,6-diaminopimelate ligase [Chlamydiales bacterium]
MEWETSLMKLKTLLKDLPEIQIKGSKETEITGITSNSKLVSPGCLFIAKKGRSVDGTQFIPEAILSGASAILTDTFDPSLKQVTQLIHPNIVEAEAKVAASYYEHPSKELWTVGVTGTNGKTTSTFAIKHLLDASLVPTGLIGTIEYVVGPRRYIASRTTPDVCANHKLLREMVTGGCRACVMEVTSHALDQGRVAEIEFDVAVFANFSHEHLDYHGTMEEYFKAKAKLFLGLKNRSVALLNADDPWVMRCKHLTASSVMTYGIDEHADLMAKDIRFDPTGTHFTIVYAQQEMAFYWPLVGRFNVYNALSAIGVGIIKGYRLDEIATRLASFRSAPGRLESIDNPLGLQIYVDYAHKPEALRNVLETLKELSRGRIITVFGCGGDRDRDKRALMAQVSEGISDITIVTSDNPRSEDPMAIINEVVTGFKKSDSYFVEPDRKKAINMAINKAEANDIILIAGKGHEAQQVFASHSIDFDDRLVARECIEQLYLNATR